MNLTKVRVEQWQLRAKGIANFILTGYSIVFNIAFIWFCLNEGVSKSELFGAITFIIFLSFIAWVSYENGRFFFSMKVTD